MKNKVKTLMVHPNHGLVKLITDMVGTSLIKTQNFGIMTVQTRTLKVLKIAKGGENRICNYKTTYVKPERLGMKKPERNEQIKQMLLAKHSFVSIAKHFGISKARVNALSIGFGIDNMGDKKKETLALVKKIKKDYKDGLTPHDVINKYSVTSSDINRLYKNGLNIMSCFRNIRNKKLGGKYINGSTAIKLTSNDPNQLKTVGGVFSVVSKKLGYYKFPNIKRGTKGLFEHNEVIKIIKDNRKKGLYYYEIADLLDYMGYKTVTGKKFTSANIRFKSIKIDDKNIKKHKI